MTTQSPWPNRIMGLARLAAGHIWIDDRPHHDPGARMRVGLVPEVPTV